MIEIWKTYVRVGLPALFKRKVDWLRSIFLDNGNCPDKKISKGWNFFPLYF